MNHDQLSAECQWNQYINMVTKEFCMRLFDIKEHQFNEWSSKVSGCRYRIYEFLLFIIARYDEIDTLKEMVQAGFNVDSQDEYGTTAMHNACANGNM